MGPVRRWTERVFLPVVVTTGIITILFSLYQLAVSPVDERWYVLAALTVLSGSATLRIPGTAVSFSISDSFTMAAALLFGPAAGTLTVAIDSLVITMRLARNPIPAKRVFYNATAPPLAMWTAAQVLVWIAGPNGIAHATLWQLIAPLAVFAGIFFILNTGLIALAIAFEQRLSATQIWRDHFLSLWLTYFGGAVVAAQLIVLMQQRKADLFILLLLAPIPLMIYATFRHAVGRMEDRVGHLDQVNGMYLSTIETLAQAIDAKDQVTHGHIRRVQQHAMKLARALGVSDPAQLRALEAASLLHDVGKLAVPEHILNKPSTLTPTEFETMKRHANIGADILSSIRFPYPVVPIVRYHHENWDGSGYPEGLSGEAIPIGARILAVVDCFDAVTSDRPYRPRLPRHEAIRVLQARSGTVYDPRVVEKFLEVFESVPTETESSTRTDALSNITRTVQDEKRRAGGATHGAETLAALFDIGFQAASAATAVDALSRIHPLLERIMPADIIAVYLYSAEADNLVATFVGGRHAESIAGTTIQLGQRLTGWVAANRQTILNSDAALDLGNLTMRLDPMPLACLSTPMANGGDLIGVVTIYSTHRQPFTDAHVPVVEVLARGLANLIPPLSVATPKPAAIRSTDTPPGIRVH